jgi:hypothetical protein
MNKALIEECSLLQLEQRVEFSCCGGGGGDDGDNGGGPPPPYPCGGECLAQ